MSALTETASFDATVNKIDNGEDIDETLLNLAPQSLANRTKFLNEKKAPLESPAFTGIPTGPTAAAGTNTNQLATTAFYTGQAATSTPTASADTAAVGTSNKFAREDHVHPSNFTASTPDIKMDGVASVGISTKPARADHVHPTDTTRAPINSPTFTGIPAAPTPANGDASTKLATTAFVINNALPAGSVILTFRSSAPDGYLKANGAAVSRTAYAGLFAAIGTMFGIGDGSTTFNLPDVRGEFPRFWDDGRGVDSGRSLGGWQAQELQSHSHQVYGIDNSANPGAQNGEVANLYSTPTIYSVTTAASGGSETRPRNVALLACIKY